MIDYYGDIKNSNFEYGESLWEQDVKTLNNLKILRLRNQTLDDLAQDFNSIFYAIDEKYGFYLYSSPNYVQDTRIARYKTLWNRVRQENPLMTFKEVCELQHNYETKIRYAGFAEISNDSIKEALIYTISKKSTGLVFFMKNSENILYELCKVSFVNWFDYENDSLSFILNYPRFINSVTEKRGIAIRCYGGCDYGGHFIDLYFSNEAEYLFKTILQKM